MISMSKKKTPEKKAVQATLGDMIAESPPKKVSKKISSGTKSKKASKEEPPRKGQSGKKETKRGVASKKKTSAATTKALTSKGTTPPKKSSKPKPKKKDAAKRAPKSVKPSVAGARASKQSKKEPRPKAEEPAAKEGQIPLSILPGIGSKMEEKLKASGYDSVEKISRARAVTLATKIEGLSKSGAEKLVGDAKRVLKSRAIPKETTAVEGELPEDKTSGLIEIPGIGRKLAMSLDAAGYNSIARLSRASPDGLSARVDGLGLGKAEAIVSEAREYMRKQEISTVLGAPDTITISAKKTGLPDKPGKAEEKPVEAVPEKEGERKVEPPKGESVSKKPARKEDQSVRRKKKSVPPKRKKPEIIRKKSGLPVPKAVAKLEAEMKKQWDEIERMEGSGELPSDMPETVEVVSLTSDDTTERLVEVALEVLNETMTTGRPAFEIPSRSSDNIVWDEFRDLLLLGMRTVSRPYHSLASVVDATRTARVMEIIFQLLRSSLHATKREVFYSDVNLFRDQKYSDKIIEDVASMLSTTRDSVHVVASARGSAMGRVTIRDGGDLIDLTKMGTGGWAVTPFLDQLEIVESDAEFILVSEKDAAVMRLAEAKYWNRQPCIVITGKGSGDIATRAFLKMLVKELEIPAFALVDSDPYGHYIYSVFLRGSKRLSYESPFIATPELKLLGVLSRDLDAFNIPKSVRIPMEPADIKRVREMLKEPFVQKNKEWVEDLKLMLNMKEKAEIQAFASHSFEFLTDEYIPQKLETGDWI
jgi:meiotic recombination protein SPO11